MSEHGGLFIRFSPDTKLDAEKIVSQLNKYDGWSADEGKWVVKGPREKCFSPFYWEAKDGWANEVIFPSLKIYQIIGDDNQVFITLRELSLEISSHIKQGHFEIVCSSQEEMAYLAFEKLTIKSDGFVQRTRISSSCMEETCNTLVETYTPEIVY